jgi:hypothetical protein
LESAHKDEGRARNASGLIVSEAECEERGQRLRQTARTPRRVAGTPGGAEEAGRAADLQNRSAHADVAPTFRSARAELKFSATAGHVTDNENALRAALKRATRARAKAVSCGRLPDAICPYIHKLLDTSHPRALVWSGGYDPCLTMLGARLLFPAAGALFPPAGRLAWRGGEKSG